MGLLVCDILRQVCTMTNFIFAVIVVMFIVASPSLLRILLLKFFHSHFYFNHLQSIYLSNRRTMLFRIFDFRATIEKKILVKPKMLNQIH